MIIKTEIPNALTDKLMSSFIEQKVAKLALFFSHIKEISITLKAHNNVEQQELSAEIKLHLPNGIIFYKESGRCIERILSKALVALKLDLLRYRTKRISYGLV